jgi:cell division protein FtsI/penicillin-binding protein 2
MTGQGKNRYRLLFLLAALLLLLVEAKLIELQFVERDFWTREAQKNRTRARTLPFKRGWIMDRNLTPLAVTQSLFELRFVFRNYRLNALAGQISMVYFLCQEERPSIRDILDEPAPYVDGLLGLAPKYIAEMEDRWKRKDLAAYIKWILGLTTEEADLIFEHEVLRNTPFAEIPSLQESRSAILAGIAEEREAIEILEDLAGVERGTFLQWPDRTAQRADRIVKRRLGTDRHPEERPSYLKLRKQHREVDSYETTVFRNLGHEATVRVALAQDLYPGFYIVESTKRHYPEENADTCPLLIGKCGLPNERELAQLNAHRRRLEQLTLVEEKTEMEMIEEENLRLKIQELDILPDEEVGRLGLEAVLESALRGKRGFILEERGSRRSGAKILEQVSPIDGQDVVLTLDAGFQRACEEALNRTGYTGAVVFMDVHTGEILAMATAPDPGREDLNRNWSSLAEDPRHPLYHRVVYNRNLPPPGSVFKLVTALAALEENLCDQEECFECTKRIQVGGVPLRCEGLHGPIAMEEALVKSCNIYFYRLGELAGYETMFRWAERFGFGARTGYLDRERYGLTGSYRGFPEGEGRLKYSEQGDANLMRFAIGQGAIDDVTPLQVARMMAGIATGKLPEVRLIARIGERMFESAPATNLAIARNHLDLVREAMKQVVIRGTAEPDETLDLDLRPFKVAGKTGTPQVGGGRPSHACFAGYFPWDEPRWSFACFIESCGLHGGEIAAPVLNRILESDAAKPFLKGVEQ